MRAEFVAADLMAETMPAVERLFADATAAMPGIDILVNNAGTYIDKPFLEMDWGTYDRTMRLNVASAYFLTQRFARQWIANKVAGRVLMIGSINGRLAEPTHSCYDTSKGAIDAMVRSLCVSLAPQNIRVNGLAPGLVRTPLTVGHRPRRTIPPLDGAAHAQRPGAAQRRLRQRRGVSVQRRRLARPRPDAAHRRRHERLAAAGHAGGVEVLPGTTS